jgi:hypothetical protein
MRGVRQIAILVLAAAPLAWPGSGACRGARKEDEMATTANQDPLFEWRNTMLGLVSPAMARPMNPVPKDPRFAIDRSLFASMSWSQRVLADAANPWLPMNHATHLFQVADADTPDLLEHRLVVDKVPVRILEASSFLFVVVPAQSLPESDPLEKAAHAARLLLQLKEPIVFRWIASDTRHRSFSSDELVTLTHLSEWQQRIDGVILDGDVGFFVVKITLDRMMDVVSSPRAWFQELRKAPRK